MNDTIKEHKQKVVRRLPISQWILVIPTGLALIAVGIPILTPDGTANYSGVKLAAARNVLDADRSNYGPGLAGGLTRARIVGVEPSPQGIDSQGKPLRCTDDPNEIQYYSVTIRRIWLFGMTYTKREYRVCNTAG